MSASTEKKNRQTARAAGTDKKTIAAQEEAKKKAASKRKWTLGTILVVLLVACILVLNSGVLYTGTTALTIGGQHYSPAEVNYRYASEYLNFVNQYGSYASLFGLDTSAGLTGLSKQECGMMEDGTWKDYFLEQATDAMIQIKALTDYAAQNGITLDAEEQAEIDEGLEGLESTAKAYGYSSANNLLAANYGTGVTTKIARQAQEDSSLANKAYQEKYDSLDYSAAELQVYYEGLEGSRDYFDYAYVYVAAETAEVTDADGNVSVEATEEGLAKALATAQNVADVYAGVAEAAEETAEPSEATEEATEATETAEAAKAVEEVSAAEAQVSEDPVERLQAALDSVLPGTTAETRSNAVGSSLAEAYSAWLRDAERQNGDITVAQDSSGCYVVVFLAREDNHYPVAQVRHILVKAVADADGVYTDEAKATAKARAEEILAEWQAGEKTEESFAALAEQYSEDDGSASNGGLYDSVYKGQMVTEFNDFCFADHQKGDTAVVYGESASYAGYHVIYYVGEGELYSENIARSALTSEDITAWLEDLLGGYEAARGFGYKLIGK